MIEPVSTPSCDRKALVSTLNELKWLRGGVLAVHAFIKAAEHAPTEALPDIDFSAMVYLTEQMQNVVVLGGTLDAHIQELDALIEAEIEQAGLSKLAALGVRPDVLTDPARLQHLRDELAAMREEDEGGAR